MAKFLVTLWEGGGNVSPVLELVSKLVESKHTVRVLVTLGPALEKHAVRAAQNPQVVHSVPQ
jgi:hypothetical protein